MGLTIHYGIKSTTKVPSKALKLVAQMRQFALDLPFESVGDIIELSGADTNFRNCDEKNKLRWLLIQAFQSVKISQRRISKTCTQVVSADCPPTQIIAFNVWPGRGCESMNLGLCSYPAEVLHQGISYKSKLSGWRWSSFCKTQYASDPECGGIPNFVRCHVSAITLLDKIATIPTIKVDMDDEGHYGPSCYSDDWREAYAANRKPTYVDHPPTYNVNTLIKECGESNEMIAAFFGALKDTNPGWESPITKFGNFEQLEFKGQQYSEVKKFLDALPKKVEVTSGT